MWKALSVIAALLAAGAAFLSYLNKNDAEQERELLAAAKSHHGEIVTRFKEVEASQVDATRKLGKMGERRTTADTAADETMAELDAKREEVKAAEVRRLELQEAIDTAKKEIAELGPIADVIALIDELKSKTFAVKNEIAGLEGQLVASTGREVSTSKSIQNIKEREFRQRNGMMKSINARIAAVYNSWGFLVLSAGDRQGVVSGTKLDVTRGGEKIAELLVTNLEPNRSVCDIIPGSMESGQMIRPGDRVSVNPASFPKPKAEVDAAAAAAAAAAGVALAPGGAGLPAPAAPAAAPEMAPAGVPAGEKDDPFGFDDEPITNTPATPPAEAEAPAPAPAPDPAPAGGGDDPFDF